MGKLTKTQEVSLDLEEFGRITSEYIEGIETEGNDYLDRLHINLSLKVIEINNSDMAEDEKERQTLLVTSCYNAVLIYSIELNLI